MTHLLTDTEKQDCEGILRALPEWFGIEESIVEYVREVRDLETYGVSENDDLLGFLALRSHFEHAAEIHVMAVRPTHHGRGIGGALLAHAERRLRERGVRWLQVKTLGPSSAYEPYERTRAFYQRAGFEPLEELKKLWSEGNPCLVMVKRL